MTSNLSLWHAVEKTPLEHTKPITGKSYGGNSPKPHYLIHKATETFGPCGIGWGFTIDERIEDGAPIGDGEVEKLHIAKVRVWYKWNGERGEVEHIGGTPFSGKRASGKPYTDEDAPKKSVTDALVKALSMIGFAGDIFMGRYDDSKYLQELREDAAEAKRESAKVSSGTASKKAIEAYTEVFRLAIDKCDFESEVVQTWRENAQNRATLGIQPDSEVYRTLTAICANRKERINMADEEKDIVGAG